MEFPSLGTFKTHLDAFLCNILQQVTLPGQEGLAWGSQRSLPNLIVLGFCEITTVSAEFGLVGFFLVFFFFDNRLKYVFTLISSSRVLYVTFLNMLLLGTISNLLAEFLQNGFF